MLEGKVWRQAHIFGLDGESWATGKFVQKG